jgi:hypothetical protein
MAIFLRQNLLADEIAEPIDAGRPEPLPPIRQRRRRHHSCFKLLVCLAVMFLVVTACVVFLVFYIAGPIVRTVDTLPPDFPENLALYQLDRAKIKVQSAADKQRLLQMINALPEWLLTPLASYLTTDLKTQVAARLQNPDLLPQNLTISDLEKVLAQQASSSIETVTLTWNDINQNKQDLYDYYKKELQQSGFLVRENLGDYEIDVSFVNDQINGAISIMDNFVNNQGSVMNMTINYLTNNPFIKK